MHRDINNENENADRHKTINISNSQMTYTYIPVKGCILKMYKELGRERKRGSVLIMIDSMSRSPERQQKHEAWGQFLRVLKNE